MTTGQLMLKISAKQSKKSLLPYLFLTLFLTAQAVAGYILVTHA